MKIPVDQVLAGNAIDIAIARALGWTVNDVSEGDGSGYPKTWIGTDGFLTGWALDKWPEGEWGDAPALFTPRGIFRPSQDIATAWYLIDHLVAYAYSFQLTWLGATVGWQAHFGYIYTYSVARTPELAICRAFLKAHGITEIEGEAA